MILSYLQTPSLLDIGIQMNANRSNIYRSDEGNILPSDQMSTDDDFSCLMTDAMLSGECEYQKLHNITNAHRINIFGHIK